MEEGGEEEGEGGGEGGRGSDTREKKRQLTFPLSIPPEVTVLNKTWCVEHFRCTACNFLLTSSR